MMILRDAGAGLTRFEQFRTSLGLAPNILAQRLKALTENDLLEKRSYSDRPPREEYVITQAGRDFMPVLHALSAWANRHNGAGEVTRIIDEQTGLTVEPVVIDRVSGAPIGTRPLRIVKPFGPARDKAAV